MSPATGTGSLSVPISVSGGRSGFAPVLDLRYDSAAGNGAYGYGWSLPLPAISRRTDHGLPLYQDGRESDVFQLAGSEDLVPVLGVDGGRDTRTRTVSGRTYRVDRYRPRTEGLFARIERWTETATGACHWRSISKDNVTTLYGTDDGSRVSGTGQDGPDGRVFSWLISASYDDKGNAIEYRYKPEDDTGVDLTAAHEHHRAPAARRAVRYPKSIRYGNTVSRLVDPELATTAWLFEVVFDYGEHDPARPTPTDAGAWLCRNDPFSSYRAGFELRTYRLCQRILLFHHFSQENGIGTDCLVRSYELTYGGNRDEPADVRRGHPAGTFLASVTQTGYRRVTGSDYATASMPPLQFEYSVPVIDRTVHEVDPTNLPAGVDETDHRWVDLDGEGIPGVLIDQAGAWLYRPNLGGGHLGPVREVASRPSMAGPSRTQHLLDLAGDGPLDLVEMDGDQAGFAERTNDGGWGPFTPFRSLPRLDWTNPNLRLTDLDGDGRADVLVTEDDRLSWYPSLGEDGFGAPRFEPNQRDERAGPRLLFADGEGCTFLADFSGDGLSDLVRIRNGSVCYWPNLGHGRFGAQVQMDAAPVFDRPAQRFDPRRLRLADIDGSGPTDLIYLHQDGVVCYANQSGNRWAPGQRLSGLPPVDDLTTVTVTDLLGTGTACLVWSSPLPRYRRSPIRYLDLTSGKPNLLIGVRNNLGARTVLHYTTSTACYLADKKAGRRWLTRLPFPVHVVDRVETDDQVSRNRFVTRYAYHHGRFDGVEREFCGFGMVEQYDTEQFAAFDPAGPSPASNEDPASQVPPMLTKTWFHTGARLAERGISRHYTDEYYREPATTHEQWLAGLLDDTVLPAGLGLAEEREACRALRGSPLRQETYALDDTAAAAHPYQVTEHSYAVVQVQPAGPNRHGVFFVHPAETLDHHYERDPGDPRISHELVLEVDAYGTVVKSATAGYPRRQPDPNLPAAVQAAQARTLVTYVENTPTNVVDTDSADGADSYRTPLPAQTITFELTGIPLPAGRSRYTPAALLDQAVRAATIPYEATPTPGLPQRRVLAHTLTRYRRDDLTGPLPPGVLQPQALPYETYRLALTPGLITRVYGSDVTEAMLRQDAGYRDMAAQAGWWAPSGQVRYAPDPAATPAAELDTARHHFFLARRFTDPFGAATTVDYDPYDLLVLEVRDAAGNRTTAGERDRSGTLTRTGNDYRTLQPALVMDANRNRSRVAYDALGRVAGTAVQGKPEETTGDLLDGFNPDPSPAAVAAYLQDPLAAGPGLLGAATTRLLYDLTAFHRTADADQPDPVMLAILAREDHHTGAPTPPAAIQHTLAYSDGLGRQIQHKQRAEPGPLTPAGPAVTPRWVGSGWTVFNNKGQPVRQYEPFFSATHRFEFANTAGVSQILCYDPPGRVVATVHPDHTYSKVVFSPWRQETWDGNDTVLQADPAADPDVGDRIGRLPPADYLPTWYTRRIDGALGEHERQAAQKTAPHAGTPQVAHADSLGRTVLTVVHNRYPDTNGTIVTEYHPVRVELDIQGNHLAVLDTTTTTTSGERTVARNDYAITGGSIRERSMDAGTSRVLPDVTGKPVYHWAARGQRFRTRYDALRRPIEVWLQTSAPAPETLIERRTYGESRPNPTAANLRGRLYRLDDAAGTLTRDRYDFKGNLETTTRTPARQYTTVPDWSHPVPLEPTGYTSHTDYDALNRPRTLTSPDHSMVSLGYNEAGLLETVTARLRGTGPNTAFVTGIDYDAKGQRILLAYGNGVRSSYDYDPDTFRLQRLRTARPRQSFPTDCPTPGQLPCGVQNLSYVYDPTGNITHIHDDAQQRVFFHNRLVEPSTDYTYDALYRLIEATGREHLGLTGTGRPRPPTPTGPTDQPRTGLHHPGDGNALGRYHERYAYDPAGNITALVHHGTDPTAPGWTRAYTYTEPGLIDPAIPGNRLSSSQVGSGPAESYGYDTHGNLTRMPHLPLMRWDHADRLSATSTQVVTVGTPETTYYTYDADGQRIQKVTNRHAAPGQQATRQSRRLYVGNVEVYTEFRADGTTATLERETLHITAGQQRIALVETRTIGDDDTDRQIIRYQIGNHLDSVSLELDDRARVISYEEYYPHGSTSYQAVRGPTTAPKRYRFTGKERDEETGFTYHEARYYAPWLARWTSPDPAGLTDGPNLYCYGRDEPIAHRDREGRQATAVTDEERYRGVAQQAAGARAAFRGAGPVQAGPSVSLRLSPEPLAGTYHLWSDPAVGKVEAKAVIQARGSGYIMGSTPDHLQAEARYEAAKLRVPAGQKLPDPEFREIWDRPSEKIATRATAAEHPVAAHGPNQGVQQRVERPAVVRSGAISAGLTVGSGAVSIYAASQSDNPLVKGVGMTSGAVQVAGGVSYAAGAVKVGTSVGTKLMQVGGAMSRFGGGVAGVAISGPALVSDVKRGDVVHGVGDAAGTATGVLTLVGATSAAAVTGAFAVGYGIGGLIDKYLLSENVKEAIGGTLNEIINEGGWREIYRHPFGMGK